jgi:hypothetical protein
VGPAFVDMFGAHMSQLNGFVFVSEELAGKIVVI